MSEETKWELTQLNKKEEKAFQNWIKNTPWYGEFKNKYNEEPNLNDSNYDYRKAWKNGVEPQYHEPTQSYHWSSKTPDGEWLKSPEHPTHWMEAFQNNYGVDPSLLMQLVSQSVGQDTAPDITTQLIKFRGNN